MKTNSFLAIPIFVYASLYLCIYPSEKRIVALFGAYLAQYLNDYKVEQLDTYLFNYSLLIEIKRWEVPLLELLSPLVLWSKREVRWLLKTSKA